MSISYSVKVPSEPRADQMVERASYYDDYFKANVQVKKAYPWSSERRPLESLDAQEDSGNDLSLKPFSNSNIHVEHDEEYEDPLNMHSKVKNIKTIDRPRLSNQFPRHRRRRKHRHHRFRPYYSEPEKALLVQPTPKSDVGLFVLPSGGPRELSDDIRNQFEDDQLLKKAAKQPFSSQEGKNCLRVRPAEKAFGKGPWEGKGGMVSEGQLYSQEKPFSFSNMAIVLSSYL